MALPKSQITVAAALVAETTSTIRSASETSARYALKERVIPVTEDRSETGMQPDVDAAKERLKEAFRTNQKYSKGMGKELTMARIAQAYGLLGGDTDDLKEIEEEIHQ